MRVPGLNSRICSDWLERFPELGKYHQNKFFKVVGPLVAGIELIDVPMMEQYRPFFFIYPMWESDVKACFDFSPIYFEFSDERKSDLNIPYRRHQDLFSMASVCVREQLPWPLDRDGHLSEVLRFAEQYLKTPRALHSGVRGQVIIRKLAVLLAAWMNDAHAVSIGLDVIRQEQKKWDRDQFILWFGDFDSWHASLLDQVSRREDLLRSVRLNLQDAKIRQLPYSALLPG